MRNREADGVSGPPSLGGDGAFAQADTFERLYRRYARSVYNLVLRSVRDPQDAEDLCQEVWYKAQRHLPSLRDPESFPSWLFRIAVRTCVDAARRRARAPEMVALPAPEPPGDTADPERSAVRREEADLAWQALAALPPRQHAALFLREVEGRSYREIAEALETTEAAVETLLFRARRALAQAYGRLEAARSERCREARRAMARLLDGEGTPAYQLALRAHAGECRPCRESLERLRRASQAYAALPLAGVPALLGRRLAEAGLLTGAASGASGAAQAGLLAVLQGKLAAAAVAAAALAAATMIPAAGGPPAGGNGPGVQPVRQEAGPVEGGTAAEQPAAPPREEPHAASHPALLPNLAEPGTLPGGDEDLTTLTGPLDRVTRAALGPVHAVEPAAGPVTETAATAPVPAGTMAGDLIRRVDEAGAAVVAAATGTGSQLAAVAPDTQSGRGPTRPAALT